MKHINQQLNRTVNNQNIQDRLVKLMEIVQKDQDVQTFIAEHRDQLTDDDILKSSAKLYEFVKEKEKFLTNDASMIAPGYEPKLFLNHHFIDVTYVPTEELLKKKEYETIRNRVQAISMPKDIKDASLDQFNITAERKEALSEAIMFMNDYYENPKEFHQGLYLYGTFGVGKTYLLGAIANGLATKGIRTTIIHFPTFCVEMKQSIKDDSVASKIDTVKKTPILMLDDIGADSMSAWIRDDVLGVILQYRMQEKLPTFFSSNLDMKQLEEEHLRFSQKGDDEPLKAKRIMERIKYLSKQITMIGENRRLDN
ncbi:MULTISPECIES: primosomal protein DnaI [Enterococcaceae]|uniref:primosomal protein DnaI n=1 Tax=Enterococcaceae TaxID=81852 RepID=UPI000E53C4E9|nr:MULTISPECIES: primosomal protein DnaI [Enterococcaceae]MCI0129781.1 primosomal protein DnaI [Vagococcus sp. CY53-2]RGI31956.1 primosomal protein DnaI [Melissococcus sp. OM08-11BH]